MTGLGKILILVGGALLVAGLLIEFFPKIPFLGKLPGDLHFKRGDVEVYIPLATSILASLILSGILWVIQHGWKK